LHSIAKATLLQPGSFKTRILRLEHSPEFPVHPAYIDPALTGNIIPEHNNNVTFGDTDKATSMLSHKLGNDPEPSLRVAVGSDANDAIK
jgi:hypothetical protein